MTRSALGALVVLLLIATRGEAADPVMIHGAVEAGSRHFLLDRGQGLHDDNVLLGGELDVRYELTESLRFRVRPILALDPLQPSRNRYEPLDAYVEWSAPRWELRAGQMIESWAIVDTFNPADVLNRRDVERDAYDPGKLGELMVRLRHFFPDGGMFARVTPALYLLPLHRTTPLPGNHDRFRLDVTGDNHGDLGRKVVHPDFQLAYAAHVGATLGTADLFLFYFGGPTRQPGFDVSPTGRLTPVYYRVDTVGGGVQWALGPWVLKLETAYTLTNTQGLPARFAAAVPENYFQYVAGVDRRFSDVLGRTDLVVTLEYAGEDRTGPTTLSAFRPYRSDVFLGVRWELNDYRRTALVASVAADVLRDEQLYLAEVRTTIYGALRLVAGGQFVNRAFDGRPGRFTPFGFFPNNSNVRVALRYEF